jgi:glutaminase
MEHLIREIYNDTKHIDEGKVADYIPQLAEVNPEMYGVAFCDLNGNITTVGDSENAFCLQSCVKPLNYCLARNQENTVENAPITHQHVGFEPSGVAFNAFVMNREKLPHNPLINSGAIMTAALIAADREPSARFDMLQKFICRLSGFGGHAIGFDNSVYLSEKVHADRNISLAYYMRENKAFPGEPTQSELNDHLELYFQSCSLTASARTVSAIAATLANHGKSPVSGETVLEPEIVMDALSIMFMCGMYDFSGQFAFNIGLPAKSGVAGALLIVIPNVGGICTWSPRLDELGNSVRGIAFCAELAKRTKYAYHIFRTLRNNADSQAVTDDEHDVRNIRSIETFTHRIIHACSANDMDTLRKLVEYGSDKFRKPDESIDDVSKRLTDLGDYDRRTCVHLAAAEGHEDVLKFLLMHGANPHPKDRWGNTPLHEVRKAYKHQVKLHGAKGYTPSADELMLRDRYKAIFFVLAEGDPLHDGNQSGVRSRSDSNADLQAEWDSISRSNSKEHLPDMLLGALESKSSGQIATHATIPLSLDSIPEVKSPMKGASDASSEPVSTVTPAPGMNIDAIKKNLGSASANQPAKAVK